MIKGEGKWSLVFEVEIQGTNSMNEDIGGTYSVSIPLDGVCMKRSAEAAASSMWNLLTRKMIRGYLDFPLESDDDVFIRNPKLVLEGTPDSLEREL